MTPEEIKSTIETAIEGAAALVRETGGGNHFEVEVVAYDPQP